MLLAEAGTDPCSFASSILEGGAVLVVTQQIRCRKAECTECI